MQLFHSFDKNESHQETSVGTTVVNKNKQLLLSTPKKPEYLMENLLIPKICKLKLSNILKKEPF